MVKQLFCRTRTINLKPVMEELEADLKFSLVFNSSSNDFDWVIEEDEHDFDIICGKVRTLWDLGFINESEFRAIRSYFYKMVEDAIEDVKKLKAK